VAILLISANKEGFFELRGMRDGLVEVCLALFSLIRCLGGWRGGRTALHPISEVFYDSPGMVPGEDGGGWKGTGGGLIALRTVNGRHPPSLSIWGPSEHTTTPPASSLPLPHGSNQSRLRYAKILAISCAAFPADSPWPRSQGIVRILGKVLLGCFRPKRCEWYSG
jgi:hypothetical protein